MPYFPKHQDNTVSITLRNGDVITLVEKQLSVGDRKAMMRRFLSLQYDFKFRAKLGEDIDKRMEAAGLDRGTFDSVAAEGVDLLEGLSDSMTELYATVLAMRFESWDVFASEADYQASNPVPLERDSIILFVENDPRNFFLLEDIINGLKGHDEREQKKDKSVPEPIGNGSTAKMAS